MEKFKRAAVSVIFVFSLLSGPGSAAPESLSHAAFTSEAVCAPSVVPQWFTFLVGVPLRTAMIGVLVGLSAWQAPAQRVIPIQTPRLTPEQVDIAKLVGTVRLGRLASPTLRNDPSHAFLVHRVLGFSLNTHLDPAVRLRALLAIESILRVGDIPDRDLDLDLMRNVFETLAEVSKSAPAKQPTTPRENKPTSPPEVKAAALQCLNALDLFLVARKVDDVNQNQIYALIQMAISGSDTARRYAVESLWRRMEVDGQRQQTSDLPESLGAASDFLAKVLADMLSTNDDDAAERAATIGRHLPHDIGLQWLAQLLAQIDGADAGTAARAEVKVLLLTDGIDGVRLLLEDLVKVNAAHASFAPSMTMIVYALNSRTVYSPMRMTSEEVQSLSDVLQKAIAVKEFDAAAYAVELVSLAPREAAITALQKAFATLSQDQLSAQDLKNLIRFHLNLLRSGTGRRLRAAA